MDEFELRVAAIHRRKLGLLILRWIFIFAMFGIAIYSIKIRFENPQLTETQLFLKMFSGDK